MHPRDRRFGRVGRPLDDYSRRIAHRSRPPRRSYLIHWPTAFANTGDLGDKLPKNADGTIKYDLDTSIEATWNAMEGLVEKGLVKQIGVSNFNEEQIDRIMAASTRAKPSVLQVESHPYWMQKQLIAHARKHGIHVTAFSPLGSPDRPWAKEGEPLPMQHPDIAAVAARHSKSPAQVLIRYQVQRGVVTEVVIVDGLAVLKLRQG